MEADYTNPWMYQGQPFTSNMIQDFAGFVYLIITPDNLNYIGRKYFWSTTKKKGQRKRVTKESNWKNYYSSCEELKNLVKEFGKDKFKRIILSLHKTKGEVNYHETREQFIRDVLCSESPKYLNSNILGRHFSKNVCPTEGRERTSEEKAKISKTKREQAQNITNNLQEFSSAIEAAEWILTHPEHQHRKLETVARCIVRVCNGRQKTAYGFEWKKKE